MRFLVMWHKQALNEYGISLVEDAIEDEDKGEVFTNIKVSKKELTQKKETIRWNQIMKYFEGMQQHKVEIEEDEDPTKVRLLSGILNKLIERKTERQKYNLNLK